MRRRRQRSTAELIAEELRKEGSTLIALYDVVDYTIVLVERPRGCMVDNAARASDGTLKWFDAVYFPANEPDAMLDAFEEFINLCINARPGGTKAAP